MGTLSLLDLGFFVEYERTRKGHPDAVSFGPLLQKEWGPTLHTLNVLFEREVGNGASSAFALHLAWQSRWQVDPLFEPGIEIYSQIGARIGRQIGDAESAMAEHTLDTIVEQHCAGR